MKKILFTAAIAWVTGLLLPTPPVAAQAPTFDRAVACASGQGPGWGPSRAAVDAQGNVFAAGSFAGTALVGSAILTAAGPGAWPDVFLAKLDAAGAYAWAVRAGGDLGDEVTALAVDASGDVLVAGYFASYRLDFGPGGPVLFNSSARAEAFVAKYNGQTGQCRWARRAGGTRDDVASAVAVNAAGEVYLAGTGTSAGPDFGPFTLPVAAANTGFLAKLSPVGTWLWARQVGTGPLNVQNLAVDAAGDLYTSGVFTPPGVTIGNFSLATQLIANAGYLSTEIFVAKCTDAGAWVWAVQGDAVTHQNAVGSFFGIEMAYDKGRGLYVCGTYRNASVRFGATVLPNLSQQIPLPNPPQPNPCVGCYYSDAFVARLDAATGAWQWAVRAGDAGEDRIGAITADQQGRVYVAGNNNDSPGFALPLLNSSRVSMAQLDGASGTWRWALPLDSAVVQGLALDGVGRVWTSGYFDGTQAMFGPTATVPQAGVGLQTGFLARLGAGPLPLATALPDIVATGLTVWPNPGGNGPVWVEGIAWGQVVRVMDVLGRQVGGGIMPPSGALRLVFTAPLAAGVYVVRGGGQARRLVVE